MSGKNYVLVPGAWLGAWAWKKVTPLLERKGHAVFPVTLTGMGERVHLSSREVGMETAVKDVLNVIRFNDLDDIVLVGHSFAVKVIASVADVIPEKVKLLIYLDSFRPEKTREPQFSFDPTGEFGPASHGGWAIPLTGKIIDQIGKDVIGENRKWMLSKSTPWPLKLASDPVTLSEKFDGVKNAHIYCTQSGDPVDDIVSGKWGELGGPYRIIDSAHFPMITKPDELADAILELSA